MRYFVLTRKFDGQDGFSLMPGPPNLTTKELRLRCRYIYLSEAAAALTFDQLISLYRAGELEGSKVWTAPDPHQTKPLPKPKRRHIVPASAPTQ